MTRRLYRCYGCGYLHFITFSCYRRLALLGTAARRDLFLSILEQVRRSYRFAVVGYVVMPEHMHLLVSEPERGTPSTVMQVLKQRFARRVLREQRSKLDPAQGRLWAEDPVEEHVWQRRFYDFPVWNAEQASGEIALHASQPGEAKVGAGAAAVALEQLSLLCLRGTGSGAGESGPAGGDENPNSAGKRLIGDRLKKSASAAS